MAINPPSVLKCDKGSNRAYVFWKNRKIYFGKWGSADSKRKFAIWLNEVYSHPKAPSTKDRITVFECIDLYLEHASRYYSKDGVPSQEFRNVSAAMETLYEFTNGVRVADFGPRKLIEIQSALAKAQIVDGDGKPMRRRYARNTINARIHRIRRCFRWCASQEFIDASIVTALDMVAGIPQGRTDARETEPVESVPVDVVKRTLPFLSPSVSAMVRIQFLCGMRPQDVCGMTGRAIDTTKDIWLYRPQDHKTRHLGRELVKTIPLAAQRILESFFRADPDEVIFSPVDSLEFWRSKERKRECKKVVSKQRKPYTTAAYGKSVVYAIARASRSVPSVAIPHWTPNQLRHSIATSLRGTVGIEASQLFLGHSKPDTTLIYAEASVDRLSEIASGIVSPFDEILPSLRN